MLTGISQSCGLLLAVHHYRYYTHVHWNWFDKHSHINLKYGEVGRIPDHRRRGPRIGISNGKFTLPPASHLLTDRAHPRDTKQP